MPFDLIFQFVDCLLRYCFELASPLPACQIFLIVCFLCSLRRTHFMISLIIFSGLGALIGFLLSKFSKKHSFKQTLAVVLLIITAILGGLTYTGFERYNQETLLQ